MIFSCLCVRACDFNFDSASPQSCDTWIFFNLSYTIQMTTCSLSFVFIYDFHLLRWFGLSSFSLSFYSVLPIFFVHYFFLFIIMCILAAFLFCFIFCWLFKYIKSILIKCGLCGLMLLLVSVGNSVFMEVSLRRGNKCICNSRGQSNFDLYFRQVIGEPYESHHSIKINDDKEVFVQQWSAKQIATVFGVQWNDVAVITVFDQSIYCMKNHGLNHLN